MFAFATLTTVNLTAQNDLSGSTDIISVETTGPGKIINADNSSASGILVNDETGAVEEFINPSNEVIIIGGQYDFLRIIQSTPQGEKVIIILKTKLPVL
jgi:hypothetical protein